MGKEIIDLESKRVVEVVATILLSISLGSFFSIITERVTNIDAFFVTLGVVIFTYVIILYGLIFVEIKKKHYLIPRVVTVILFSLVPYIFLRTYGKLEVVNLLEPVGLSIYFLLLALSLLFWGAWELISERRLGSSFYKDARIIVGALIAILIILDFVGIVEVVKRL